MTREEIIERLENIAEHAIHEIGENPFILSLDDGIAVHKAIEIIKAEPCEDAISRQAVCNIIDDIRDCVSVNGYWAFLERLKKLPSVNPQPNKEDIHREREQAYMRGYEDGSRKYRTAQSEDAISRQAAEKITWEEPSYSDALNVLTEVRDKVRALPPVNPQLKTGHWIISPNDCFATCSECGLHGDKGIYKHYGWCPHCGAKMEEEE